MFRRLTVAVDDLSKRTSHTLQIADLALYRLEVNAGHTVCIRARLIGVMREREQLAHLIDREAKFTSAPDECEPFNGGIVVLPISVARAIRGR
jgi:hypothetical protein